MRCEEFSTRFDLTDEEYALIEVYLPAEHSGKAGHPWANHRKTIDGILWIMRTGAPWRDLPARYGAWSTAHNRLTRWCQDGRWERMLAGLQALARKLGQVDWRQGDVDGTIVRAHQSAAGAEKKGRTDGKGKPAKSGSWKKPGRTDDEDTSFVRRAGRPRRRHDYTGSGG